MITLRPLVLGIAAIATLSLAGCGADTEREMGYKDVEIQEYQRQIKELEDQLYAANAGQVKQSFANSDGKTSLKNVQDAVGRDIDVTDRPVEVVLSIESEVLFKAGSATLSGQAKASLNKAVAVIKDRFPGHDIRVVGYTDDQKVSRSKGTWNDNWDLSAGRAREVLLYIQGRGIEASRLGLAGYGDQRPLVPNTNAENRQKNRRVEIVVIPRAK